MADFEQVIIKIVILLGMPRQTASKLLYDDSYLIINKKEHAKHIITVRILKLVQEIFFFFTICKNEREEHKF